MHSRLRRGLRVVMTGNERRRPHRPILVPVTADESESLVLTTPPRSRSVWVLISIVVPCLWFAPTSASAQLAPLPGHLLGIDWQTGTGLRTLVEFAPDLTIVGTLPLVGSTPGAPVGVAWIDGIVYVATLFAPSTLLHSVDLDTGVMTQLFSIPGSAEGLGSAGSDLIFLVWPNTIVRTSITGDPVATLSLVVNPTGTGIDSDGERYFVGNYEQGTIEVYDATGVHQETVTIGAGLPGDWISGLTYDSATDSFWVALGFGSDELINVSSDGTILLSSPAGFPWINGITIVPTTVEPFVRGDCNGDQVVEISDAVYQLASLFIPGSPPVPCEDACDGNDDGGLDISDVVFGLAYLLIPGSPVPPPPSPGCGEDPTADPLACNSPPCP